MTSYGRHPSVRLGACALFIQCALAMSVYAATPAAPAASSPELDELQKKYDLEKQRNALQADLLASQKALIDAQKASVDSQVQLLGSQKSQLDALFPAITGGKTGAITFDATNIGPLAQPGAVDALRSLAGQICAATIPKAGTSVVLATDGDLKLIAQGRWINLQIAGIEEGYKSASVTPTGATTDTMALGGAGLALYGVGAALKEVASFTQLFRTDTTVYAATIKLDQDTVNQALAECLIGKTVTSLFLPKTLLVSSLSNPTASNVQESLKRLADLRRKADAELNTLSDKKDDPSKRKAARLTALNASMDALVTSLFATSDKSPEPMFVGVLAGEAILQKLGQGAFILQTSLVNAAASGIKRTSIWRSDRLYSWSTVTINYALYDSTGNIVAAGAANNSPEPRKIVVTP